MDLSVRSSDGKTAKDLANDRGLGEIVKALQTSPESTFITPPIGQLSLVVQTNSLNTSPQNTQYVSVSPTSPAVAEAGGASHARAGAMKIVAPVAHATGIKRVSQVVPFFRGKIHRLSR